MSVQPFLSRILTRATRSFAKRTLVRPCCVAVPATVKSFSVAILICLFYSIENCDIVKMFFNSALELHCLSLGDCIITKEKLYTIPVQCNATYTVGAINLMVTSAEDQALEPNTLANTSNVTTLFANASNRLIFFQTVVITLNLACNNSKLIAISFCEHIHAYRTGKCTLKVR